MRGALIIAAFICAWAALYNGIVAFGAPPLRDDELVTVTGIVRHVDQPLMRNRLVEQVVLHVELASRKGIQVPAPTTALTLVEARALEGKTVTALVAGLRPRNRWLYDLQVDGRHIVRLDAQRAKDALVRRAHVLWMIWLGVLAALVFAASLRVKHAAPRRDA